MRKILIASALVFPLLGASLVRAADPAMLHAGSDGESAPSAMDHPMMNHHDWERHHRIGALVVPAADRKLTGPEVQRVASAFLIWNGNRDWQVVQVVEQPDKVLFAYATKSGDVIARFSIDRHTGEIDRVS